MLERRLSGKKNPSCMLHSCINGTIVNMYICISDSTCVTIRCMLYVLTQMLCSSLNVMQTKILK